MPLNIPKQIKYHTLCSNLLPDHYQPNDSSRMTLGFFTLSSLDLLGVLHDDTKISPSTRLGWIDWIYSCQLVSGGFRGSSSMDLFSCVDGIDVGGGSGDVEKGDERGSKKYDPANIPATFFALVSLLVLGDDLSRVRRKECLDWLPRLQREDGSFGEVLIEYLNEEGNWKSQIEGGTDLRYCCCAAGVAYILQSSSDITTITTTMTQRQQPNGTLRNTIIDDDALVRYVQSCQSYNGGFGESPDREPHSGLTYCGVAALGFVSMLRDGKASDAVDLINDWEGLVRWIVCRQTDVLEEVEDEEEYEDEDDDDDEEEQLSDFGDEEDDDDDNEENDEESKQESGQTQRNQQQQKEKPNKSIMTTTTKTTTTLQPKPSATSTPLIAGFNGREGKIADTCYCWWNTGALAILNHQHLTNIPPLRLYLLDKVQHMIGGFGKGVGAPPDVMHSYLGLAALAVFDEDGEGEGGRGLKKIDPVFCISCDAVRNLGRVKWKRR